jgi:hypothetical protein
MDVLAATLLSNTAIDLVRCAEGKLDLLLKRPSKYPASKLPVWCLLALLYHHHHPLPDDVNIRAAVVPSDVIIRANVDDYDKMHANWCFWPVYTGLRFCVNRVKKFKYLDANEADLESIGAHSVKDIKRTFDLAKEFRIYTSANQKIWAQDEVTSGMKLMFTDHCIPIWATFGIQTLLDIQDINGYRMGEGKGYNVPYNHLRARLDTSWMRGGSNSRIGSPILIAAWKGYTLMARVLVAQWKHRCLPRPHRAQRHPCHQIQSHTLRFDEV